MHCFDLETHNLLVGIVSKRLCDWESNGVYVGKVSEQKTHNLKLRLKVKTFWVNVYLLDGVINLGGGVYATKEDATELIGKKPNYLKTIPITNEPEE